MLLTIILSYYYYYYLNPLEIGCMRVCLGREHGEKWLLEKPCVTLARFSHSSASEDELKEFPMCTF